MLKLDISGVHETTMDSVRQKHDTGLGCSGVFLGLGYSIMWKAMPLASGMTEGSQCQTGAGY